MRSEKTLIKHQNAKSMRCTDISEENKFGFYQECLRAP